MKAGEPLATTADDLPASPRSGKAFAAAVASAAALLWLIAWHLEISFTSLAYSLSDMGEYFARYRRPDFSDSPRYLQLMGVTLAIALWGTIVAFLIAFVLAPLAARNFAPSPYAYRIARETLNFMRAMPDLLLALIFVAALGLGPMPGVLALGIHTAGFLGKFFAESLERVNKGVYEGVAATGANFPQIVMYAGWPSIVRESSSYTLYIFDRNVRMATVLGLVGAGGVGLALHDTLRLFEYDQSAALIIVILGTILFIEHASSWLRKKLS